jgi:large subunit ribosomal protein L24
MKKEFSTAWKASSQPRKQRKYLAKAPLHLRKKFVSVNLSKELRKKYGKRNIPLRKGDKVKIMVGKFSKKDGKVLEVRLRTGKIYVEGMQVKKQDGSKSNVPIKASNLQIIELNLDDKKRVKKLTGKEELKTKEKTENKEDTKMKTSSKEEKK